MTAEQGRQTIAGWVRAGLPYRTWTVRETTFVLYEEYVELLYNSGLIDGKGNLREFLRLCGDEGRLGALDRETMGQGSRVEVQDTPPLRGR